eukprot:2293586-Pleurochrysis_carterae.AAC.2
MALAIRRHRDRAPFFPPAQFAFCEEREIAHPSSRRGNLLLSGRLTLAAKSLRFYLDNPPRCKL